MLERLREFDDYVYGQIEYLSSWLTAFEGRDVETTPDSASVIEIITNEISIWQSLFESFHNAELTETDLKKAISGLRVSGTAFTRLYQAAEAELSPEPKSASFALRTNLGNERIRIGNRLAASIMFLKTFTGDGFSELQVFKDCMQEQWAAQQQRDDSASIDAKLRDRLQAASAALENKGIPSDGLSRRDLPRVLKLT